MRLQSDNDKVAHLLRRFGLGASQSEMEYYAKDGLKGAIDRLMDTSRPSGFDFPPQRFAQERGNLPIRNGQVFWLTRLVCTQSVLRDRMSLFWHDHFATSAQKVDQSLPMLRHIETLRTHGMSRFEDLLLAVSRDPAMIFWLDNQLNKKGKPNENFAREIMELFTLGIGHYSEKDIQEAARAFTGWGYGRGNRQTEAVPRLGADFVFDSRQHDSGVKSILGNKGPFSGEDVCGILAGHPQTSVHLVTKMWEYFAYEKPEPSLVTRLTKLFRDNGLRIDALVRAIMESPEFYSDKAARRVYKSPVDFCIATLRQMGYGPRIVAGMQNEEITIQQRQRLLAPVLAAQRSMRAMGMDLLFPPDVAGWDWGSAWISSATMVERMKWADRLFSAPMPQQINLRFPIADLLKPGEGVDDVPSVLCSLFDVQFPASKMQQLRQAALDSGTGTQRTQLAAHSVTRLIFGSPEFQFN